MILRAFQRRSPSLLHLTSYRLISNQILVRGLNPSLSSQDVSNLFKEYGVIKSVTAIDAVGQSEKQRKIVFSSISSAIQAKDELDNTILRGDLVHINFNEELEEASIQETYRKFLETKSTERGGRGKSDRLHGSTSPSDSVSRNHVAFVAEQEVDDEQWKQRPSDVILPNLPMAPPLQHEKIRASIAAVSRIAAYMITATGDAQVWLQNPKDRMAVLRHLQVRPDLPKQSINAEINRDIPTIANKDTNSLQEPAKGKEQSHTADTQTHTPPAKPVKLVKAEKVEEVEKTEKGEKVEEVEKMEKEEKVENIETPQKAEDAGIAGGPGPHLLLLHVPKKVSTQELQFILGGHIGRIDRAVDQGNDIIALWLKNPSLVTEQTLSKMRRRRDVAWAITPRLVSAFPQDHPWKKE